MIPKNKIEILFKIVTDFQSKNILNEANQVLKKPCLTITSVSCERSMGSKHDFYSEGDYWWPDPANPDGPYIKKDGQSNPDNFTDHRILLMDMARSTSLLNCAYIISNNETYAYKAIEYLNAWFVNKNTKVNPNLEYAQAIKGICSGRGIGVIDFLHLVEPALSVALLKQYIKKTNIFNKIIDWFREYLIWLINSDKALEESREPNNHGTSWLLQVSTIALLTENFEIWQKSCNTLIPKLVSAQIDEKGRQTLEINRTKPYCYCNFNLDILSTLYILAKTNDAKILTNHTNNLLAKAFDFMLPFAKDKDKWPYPKDINYFKLWPTNHIWLIFAYLTTEKKEFMDTWKKLPEPSKSYEVIRNTPINQPILWLKFIEENYD